MSSLMTDPRYTKLAKLLISYSVELKKGDRILLDMIDVPDEFTVELMRAARAVGGIPLVECRHSRVTREVLRGIGHCGRSFASRRAKTGACCATGVVAFVAAARHSWRRLK